LTLHRIVIGVGSLVGRGKNAEIGSPVLRFFGADGPKEQGNVRDIPSRAGG
jgi:hypothetical protein